VRVRDFEGMNPRSIAGIGCLPASFRWLETSAGQLIIINLGITFQNPMQADE